MKIPRLRWWIGGLLFLASVLNYIDRQTLSLLAPVIQADLGLSDAHYGNIVSLFLAAYTLGYLFSGRIVDALGTRVSLALFVGWWSVANALTGFARSGFSLGGFRFLLGLGEAGGYTASPKVVAEWFPAKERGVAVGLYSVGGAVGATLAPILVIGLASVLPIVVAAAVVAAVLGLALPDVFAFGFVFGVALVVAAATTVAATVESAWSQVERGGADADAGDGSVAHTGGPTAVAPVTPMPIVELD